jgi:chromosome segregation ATPase
MKRQRIIALTMTVLLLIPTIAYAKGNNDKEKATKTTIVEQKETNKGKPDETKTTAPQGKSDQQKAETGQAKADEHKDKKDAKKAEIEAFKEAMKLKHKTMTQLKNETQELKKQVELKKEELKATLEELKSGAKTLPEDQLNKLISLAQNLVTDGEKLKETAKIETGAVEEQAKAGGFNNALNALETVIGKMQLRLDALKKLNTHIDAMLAIASEATVPTQPVADTTTPTSTPTTGTTTPESSPTTDGTTSATTVK